MFLKLPNYFSNKIKRPDVSFIRSFNSRTHK